MPPVWLLAVLTLAYALIGLGAYRYLFNPRRGL